MVKQSIFGRISTLVRANINSLIDQAEDPQKMIDQLVRDYTNSVADAEAAIAETIGNLRLLERDHEEDVQAAKDWGNKAIAASRKADELRSSGNTADADKFDNLAKIALQRQTFIGLGNQFGYERVFEHEFGVKRGATRPGAFFGSDSERSAYHKAIYGFVETTPLKQLFAFFFVDYTRLPIYLIRRMPAQRLCYCYYYYYYYPNPANTSILNNCNFISTACIIVSESKSIL